jgi:hypothetical protein
MLAVGLDALEGRAINVDRTIGETTLRRRRPQRTTVQLAQVAREPLNGMSLRHGVSLNG